MRVAGGCHCGAVRFACEIAESIDVLECNCSICAKTGFQHVIVPHADFALEAGEDALQSYRFGTGTAEHLFCKVCGIKSFYQPRSHPDGWSVNLRCLDQGHGLKLRIAQFDGQNWESARAGIA